MTTMDLESNAQSQIVADHRCPTCVQVPYHIVARTSSDQHPGAWHRTQPGRQDARRLGQKTKTNSVSPIPKLSPSSRQGSSSFKHIIYVHFIWIIWSSPMSEVLLFDMSDYVLISMSGLENRNPEKQTFFQLLALKRPGERWNHEA